jgi:branched-chain amino acid transport system ATP-binding protein
MAAVVTAEERPINKPTTSGLRLWSVTAGYGEVVVLHDVSLAVPAGEVAALLGPNGAGKTTLLRSILGLARIRGGTVAVNGKDITGVAPHQAARAGVCYVPEGRAIYRSLTVEENLRLFARGVPFRPAAERVFSLFPVLAERTRQTAGTMSGGQQQMLALSRALVRESRLLLIDELSMGLAPVVIDELFQILGTLKRAGLTALIVEQYVERALALADIAYVMAKGEIVLAGEGTELRNNSDLLSLYLASE